MQKRIMWFAIFLLAICNKIAAEDKVYISDFSISPGETREINVMLDNEDTYVGFQFDVYLPDGFTITSCSKSDRIPDGTTVLGNQRTDDTGSFYRVIGASLAGNAITGTSGTIVTLTVTADANVALNDYTGYLRNIKVSKANGTGLTKDQETFTITVKSPEPYAALSSDNKTLTFYYDSQKQTRSGMSIGPFASGSNISWYIQRTSITTVVFDASFANYTNLTSTANWFIGCHNLTTITGIANLKTDNVTSMVSMFSNCVNLHWVDVSGFNTSNVTDMSNMFMNCSKLEYVDVTHFNTAKVNNMSGMFYGCTDLSGLDVSGFDTGNVTTMKEMFRDCSSLSTLDISNFNTAKVTTMLGMFFGCSHLRALEFGNNFVTSKVQSMSMMFAGCKYLETLDLSNFDTSSVLGMYNMFESCWGLTSLDLSTFNTANLLDMSAMFYDCANLNSINLSSFNTAKVKNMVSMFKDCTSLTTITVGSEWSIASVTDNGGDMFSGCTELIGEAGTTYDENHIDKEYARIDEGTANPGYLTGPTPEPYAVLTDNNDDVTIDGTTVKGKTLTFYYDKKKGADGMSVGPFNKNDERSWNGVASTITSVVLDESFANCTTLTSTAYWFSLCSKLKTITGIDNLKTDNVTSMVWMFEGCSSLTSLDVSRFNTKKVSHMLGMFSGCSSLTSLDVSNFNTENVGDMEYLFSNCSNLTSIDLSNFKTDNVFFMSKMFYNCQSLTSLDLGNFKTDKVGKMFAMFYGCRRLESLDLSSFNTSNVGDMGSLFSECSALKTLNLSSFNTSNVWQMESMFSGCSSLTSLDVSHFNTANVTDMNAMFYGCSGLTSLDVTNFNTANVTNMGWMFLGCSNLTSLDVTNFNTEKVTCMTSMFNDCSSLKKLDVTNFQTSNVTEMLAMFNDCSSLSTIDLSNFNTSNVTDMRTMFDGCSGLTSLDVSSFNTEKVTGMSYMFGGCFGLTELDLTNFKTGNVTIMADMFSGCTKLKSIYVGSDWSTSAVTRGEEMFKNCTALVGGDGTTYDANHDDVSYAHIDGGISNPGYLTDTNNPRPEPYAVLSDNNTKLTFYYDKNKDANEGKSVGPFVYNEFQSWYDVREQITAVVFHESFANCTSITSTRYWFFNCKNLTSITGLKNLNTVNVKDMEEMFSGCSNLTELDVSHFNTVNVEDMALMFNDCSKLTLLDLSNFNTANVKSMSSMFEGCSGLTSLDLSSFETGNVTSMGGMFRKCGRLESLDLSSFNTEKVEYMQTMFSYCPSLRTLDLSSFNTANVKYMGYMFDHSTSLETIYVSDSWSTAKVTNGDYTFSNCDKLKGGKGTAYDSNKTDYTYAHIDGGPDNPGYLTEIVLEPYAVLTDNDDEITTDESTVKGKTLTFYYDTKKENRGGMDVGPFIFPDRRGWHDLRNRITTVIFNTSFANYTSLSSTKYWFNECSNLKTITDINNLKTENVTDMSYMFYRCSGLTSLDISGFNTENVTNMCYMFTSCSGLTNLDVSRFETGNVTDMGGFFYGCSGLKNLDVSNFNTDNVTNMRNMFDGCSGLTSLDVRNFNTENVTNMYRIFAGCSSLTSLDVSRFKTSNVTDMGWMFDDCSGVMNLDVSRFETGNVTNMGGMFNKCSGLKELDVSNFKMENVTQMWSMFKDCSSLTSLDVSHFNTSNATSMSSMFYGCSGLTSLDVSGFKTDKVTEMGFMFKACSSLTSLDVSGFKTEQVKSMEYMFDDCPRLTSLDVSGFNTEKVIGMSRMFNGCSSLTTLDVSNFKTGYVTEMYAMFAGCTSLTSLDMANFITDKVTNINGLFRHCSALTTIYVGDGWTTENLTEGGNVFNNCTALIGGQGTSYDANHTDYTYAHIDGGTSNPGYFTDKNKKNVTITAKSCSREYGEANPTFEYTVEGATLSGEPTITCEATATSPVGTYPIVITYTAEDASKMNLTYVNGTLTITKAPLTITAKSYTIKRGSALPTFEVEYSGFKNSETDTVFTKKAVATCEAKADTVVGTYQIVVSGAEAANYEMEYVNGTLTITDDVVVTAKSYTREYGDANPTFEYTVDGAKQEGTPAITCEATATSPVGTYDIIIAKGNITNKDVTFVKGTLTITKAPLTITAKSYTVKQGKDMPTLELEYSGFKNNETDTVFTTKPTVTTEATKNSDAGTYEITVSGAEANNYEIKYEKGTLTIKEKAENFDGIVLTVDKGGDMDDAFEDYGGRVEAAKTIAAIIWNNNVPLTDAMLNGISNPNLLVYVSEASMAPKDVKNLVVNGKATNIVLVDADGNNNFFVPQEFTTENISYSRIFKQTTQDGISRGWEGICLPFDVQKFIHEEHGEISPFANSTCDYHFWLRQPTDDGVINALSIEANKPYIISMPNSDEYDPEFNHPGLLRFISSNVTIPATKVDSVWLGDSAQIAPTFLNIEAAPDIYVLNVGDSIQNYTEGSIFISNYRSARPFEVYTFHEPRSNETNIFGSRIISLSSLFGSNGTTGVNDAMKTAEPNGESWYDMNGRRLQSKPTRRGIYIRNGKKVVIK